MRCTIAPGSFRGGAVHIILKNHIEELAADFEYVEKSESKLFELFCNYFVVSKHFLGRSILRV
jgi:hypothetical protein